VKRFGIVSSVLLLALMVAARFAGAPMILASTDAETGARLVDTLGVLMAVAAAFVLDRLFRFFYLDGYLRRKLKRETPALIEGLITIALLAFGASVGLFFEAGVPFTGLITASGATAVVLGLALQEAIKDVFGGLSLNIDGSIIIGDWLTIYSEQFEEPIHGRVQGITWRSTFVRLCDGRCLVVPNHVMTTHPVMNHSRPSGPKRLWIEIPIDNHYPAGRAMSILLGEAYRRVRVKPLAHQPAPDIYIDRFDMTTTYLRLRFYADPDKVDPDDARSLMTEPIHTTLLRHNIPRPVNRVDLNPAAGDAVSDTMLARRALGHAPFFRDVLDGAQLDTLAEICKVRTLGEGAVFIRQGETGTSMFVILEGAARVHISMAGEERDVAVLAGGDIVGEMSLMTGAPRAATVTSLTEMRMLEVTKDAIEPLLAAQPGLLERFSNVLALRQTGLSEIASTSVKEQELERDLLAQMRRFFSRAFR